MAKRSGNKFVAFIGALLVAALICGVVYFVYVYTGEFSTDFKTFYVEIDGTKYINDASNLTFTSKTTRVDVHYTFEKVQSNKLLFHYELIPTGSDFNFTVDGEKVSWLNVEGLDKAFNAKSDDDGITLDCSNKTLLDVLQFVYPNSEIQLPEVDELQPHYKLIVLSEDKKTSVALSFCTQEPTVPEGITLDKTQITF